MTSVSTDRRQGLNSSAAIKVPVRVATTASIAHAGLFDVDGVTLVAGDRVLDKDNADATLRGIWVADTGNWSRDRDFDGAYDALEGTIITVNSGGTNGGTAWRLSTTAPTIGTSSLAFVPAMFSALAATAFQQAGTSAVSRTAQNKMRDIVSVLDYGVVANDSSAAVRAANVTAMRALTATVANGGDADMQFKGEVWFPKGDTYYFDAVLPFRDGIRLELSGSTLDFTALDSTAEDASGFLYWRRDGGVKNGNINVDYVASVANRGLVIKLNPRSRDSDQGASAFFLDNYEEDQAPKGMPGTFMADRPGNFELRNLRLKSNNPKGTMLQIFGGYQGIVLENLWFDGQSAVPAGIDYEFGFADIGGYPNDASPISHSVTAGAFLTGVRYRIEVVGTTDFTLIGSADNNVGTEFIATGAGAGTGIASHYWKSSHGCNLLLRNVHFINIDAALATCFSMRGAYNVTVENFYAKDVYHGISFGMGEASYAYPGEYDEAGAKYNLRMYNIVIQNHAGTAIGLSGSTSWSGYLAPLAIQQQPDVEIKSTELLFAVVENFVATGPGSGISADGGTVSLRNGKIQNCSNGIFNSGTKHLTLENVDILDCTNGIRNLQGSIYISGWTDRTVNIKGGTIAGSVGAGIGFEAGQCNTVIDGVTFGYNTPATGQFTVTGGTANPGTNKLTSLTVNGVEILTGPGTDVDWVTSNTATAAAIVVAINAYTATSGFDAFNVGATVLIRDTLSSGAAINGQVVVPTVAGDMTVGSIKDLSGGKLDTTQTYSVYVSAHPALPAAFPESSVTIKNCNTRYATSGIAYGSNVALATGAVNTMVLENNRGNTTFSGPWSPDEGSYTGTLTGCTTAPTGSIEFAQRGHKIFVHVPAFAATSNAVTKTITGALPSQMRPAATEYFTCLTKDNGGAYVAASGYITTGGVITLFAGPNDNAFTAAGAFGVRPFSFAYNV
jgi:hypothetical protein